MVREEFWVSSFAYPLVWFYGQTDTSHEYLLHTVNISNDTFKEPTSSLSLFRYMVVSPILSPLYKNIN